MKFRNFILVFLIVCLGIVALAGKAEAATNTPKAPVATASTSEYSGKVQLDWNAVDGASSYKIYRSTSETGSYSRVMTTTKTTFVNSSTIVGTKYYYYVVAVDSKGNVSDRSNTVSQICCLPRPSITLSNLASTGKPKITWNKVEGATGYKVYRATSKDGKYSRIYTTSGTSCTNTSAVAGTQYYYKVIALHSNSAANSAYSSVGTRTCDLPRPQITSCTNVESSGKPRITWNAVEGAAKYKVYRATSKDGTYTSIYTTTGTSCTNTSTTAGTQYYYKVIALHSNSAANSAYSDVVTRTCDLPRPSITLSNVASSGKVKISWQAVEGATKYQVYNSKDGQNFKRISTTTKTSVTNTSAEAGIKYYYKVRAIAENSEANSAFSTVRYRTCDLARPVVTLSNIAQTDYIRLEWEAIEGAAEYRVYRSTEKDGSYTRMAITTENSFIDSSALVDVNYFYKVIAYCTNTDGNSSDSNICNGTCSRMSVVAVLNENGKPRLTWNGVEGAVTYSIYRSIDGSSNSRQIATTEYTSLTNSSAASGITYRYTVYALDADGNVLRQSDNQACITVSEPENEVREACYVKGILLSLYKLPDSQAEYLTVPYMTPVQLGAAISSSEKGSWYRVFYKDDLYYVWLEPGEDLFTVNGSTFQYSSDNPYQQEVIDLAAYIALNWKTVYEHNASMGEQKPDGTYGFDCSGFIRYVMNTVMQQYVPTYKIVAEIEDLVVTDSIYNEGYNGAFSAHQVTLEDIQPGDVIFFTQKSENDHCGIYLGNGEFAHSSSYWENSVCISPLIDSYKDQISVIRRYLPDEVIPADTIVTVDPHNKDGSTTTLCKLYQERSTDSSQLRILYPTDTVTVLFTDSDLWAYVRLDDNTCGWILTRNLGAPCA